MTYDYNIQEIKENLTIEQVSELVAELGGEPRIQGSMIISKTICHGGDSHKLWYYDNTHLFRCYTGCAEPTFDIFELVRKVKTLESGSDYQLPQAVNYVASYFGFSKNALQDESATAIDDYFDDLESYERIKEIDLKTQTVELKTYEAKFLKYLPKVEILPWLEDNITQSAMDRFEIAYEPKGQAIIIPHRDIEGNLIGIRQRTLIQENAEKYGKYLPLRFGGVMYNHPLSFNLFGLYQNKDNIKRIKKAIVLESEKAVLQMDSIMSAETNIAVACTGSNLIAYQVKLLMDLGVNEIIVGFDHDWMNVDEEAAQRKIRNLKQIQKKYGNFVKLEYIWDKNNLTPRKASPSDCGSEIFWELFNSKVNLY